MNDADNYNPQRLDPAQVAALVAGANERRLQPATRDDPAEIRARIDQLARGYENDAEEGPAPKHGDHGTCAALVGSGAQGTAACGYEIALRAERTALMADGTDGHGRPGGRLVRVWRHADVAIDHMHAAQPGGPA